MTAHVCLTDSIRNHLIDTAQKSTQLHRHGAVLLRGMRIISSGCNSIYGNRSIHAEIRVLEGFNRIGKENRARRMSSLTLVVSRWNGANFIFSKPCKFCTSYIKKMGVKKVIYTDISGDFVSVRTNRLQSDHICGLGHV